MPLAWWNAKFAMSRRCLRIISHIIYFCFSVCNLCDVIHLRRHHKRHIEVFFITLDLRLFQNENRRGNSVRSICHLDSWRVRREDNDWLLPTHRLCAALGQKSAARGIRQPPGGSTNCSNICWHAVAKNSGGNAYSWRLNHCALCVVTNCDGDDNCNTWANRDDVTTKTLM